MDTRVLLFVFCIIISVIVEGSPSNTKSSVKVKDTSLLGAKLKLATYSFSFDEDLYVHKSNYCPAYNCTLDNVVHMNQPSCVCDYTDKTNCGTGFEVTSPSTPCSCDATLCSSTSPSWAPITFASGTFKIQLKAGETYYWRLFVNSGCTGFKTSVTTHYGTSTLMMSTEGIATAKNSFWMKTNRYEKEEIVICPTDPHYIQGTYFIAVTAFTDTVFDLVVEELMVAEPKVASPETCGDLSQYPWLSNAKCLFDGVPASFSNTSAVIPPYVFNVSFANRECAPVFIHLQEYTTGQKTSFDVIFPADGNSTQYSSSSQESFIVCPSDSAQWMIIQINMVPALKIGSLPQYNYRLTVSTSHFDHWTHTRLIDIPTYEVNFDLLGAAAVDALPYGIEGPDSKTTCNNWRMDCKGLSFAISDDPLFPVPPILLNLPGAEVLQTVEGDYSIDAPLADSKTFTAIVLLSYVTDAANVSIIPESFIEEILIEFRGKVGNLAGAAISGSFTATQTLPPCNFKEFKKHQQRIEDLMDAVSLTPNTSEVNNLLYQIGSIAFQDAFNTCEDLVEDLTVGISNVTAVSRNYYCTHPAGSEEFFADPCCSGQAELSSTCYMSNTTFVKPQFAIQTQAQNTCKNYGCATPYLQDFSDTKAALDSGQCALSLSSQQSRKDSAIKNYLKCKDQAFPFAGKTCLRDSDCFYSYDNITYACSMNTRTCVVPQPVMEMAFLKCLRSRLSSLQELYLGRMYNFTFPFGDPRVVTAWLTHLNKTDCTANYGNSINLAHRKKVLTVPTDRDCADVNSCDSFECQDGMCQYPENTCQHTCGMTQFTQDSSESQCVSESVCNWDAALCEGQSLSTCTSLCQGSNFCGFCDSEGDCTQISEITNSAVCASTSVCILPNGTYFFNLTDSECDSLTKCDLSYCGRECSIASSTNSAYDSGICFSYEASSTNCLNEGGDWVSNVGPGNFSSNANICVYTGVSDLTSCASYSNSRWESCGSISLYECSQCANGDCGQLTQNLMTCAVSGKPCSDASTCTSSGICSDSQFLVDMESVDQVYGICVIPKLVPSDSTSYLYCPPGMTTLPKHCAFDPSVVYDMETCSNASSLLEATYNTQPAIWLNPAETKNQCLNLTSVLHSGCKELDGNQERFSLKTKGNCTQFNTEWANTWKWQQGRWIGGVKRSLSWTARQAYPKYNWTNSIDLIKLQEDFIGLTDLRSAAETKSAVLCEYQLTLDPMHAVSCDCSGSDSRNCFDVEATSLLGQTVICQNLTMSRNYSGATIKIYNDTVPFSCITARISKISQQTFSTKAKEQLLSNFIPLTERYLPPYAIENEHGIVVGNILTDGVSVKPLGLLFMGIFELCIMIPGSQDSYEPQSIFPVLDFGIKNSTLTDVTVLNVPVYPKLLNSSVYLCANVGNISTENSYFGIERKSEYNAKEESLLSSTALALTLTLAFLFLVASLMTTGQLGFYVYNWAAGNIPLLLEHFLCLFIWMFVNVRTIYFFLLAAGFQSNVGDYALVALPTFFYFTAFTIIVVLWAVVASKKFTNDSTSFQKLVNKILIGVNGGLYTLFLIVVLCFQFAKETTSSPCGGSEDNSSELKRDISIAYGLVIAAVSLLIGVLFVVFGLRLRLYITSQTHDKIFIVTAVCSGCFILHSAFIVAVAVMNTPNLYFSFFGLLITELFPALFIICWVFVKRASHVSSSQEKSSVNLNTMKRSGSPYSLDGGSSGSRRDTGQDSLPAESL